jgi:hypothetical protein
MTTLRMTFLPFFRLPAECTCYAYIIYTVTILFLYELRGVVRHTMYKLLLDTDFIFLAFLGYFTAYK